MQDFIQSAAKELGVSEQTAQSATGILLQMMQKHAGAGDLVQSRPGRRKQIAHTRGAAAQDARPKAAACAVCRGRI